METLDIKKFDPTVEELNKLATEARAVTLTDVNDKQQRVKVADTRKALKAVRVRITKTGKEMRDGAIRFQKEVIAKEKELVAIIEPEELRLDAIEKEIERAEEAEKMKLLLPVRKQRITSLLHFEAISDDELCSMDIPQFEAYFVKLQQASNDIEAKKLADAREKVDAEAKRLADEKTAREREENARREERERIEREAREKKEREDREAKEKADREAAAKAKAEADALYKEWYTVMTASDPRAVYHTAHGADGEIVLWKRVGTYKPSK